MNMGNVFNFQEPESSDSDESSSSAEDETNERTNIRINETMNTLQTNVKIDKSHHYRSDSTSSSGSSSDHKSGFCVSKNQTDSAMHMFSTDVQITVESVHELEKDLEFSDVVSLLFLLYDGLIGLQEMHTTILGGAQGFSGKLSKWSLSKEKNWTMKLIESLAVTQNYRVLKKLGYNKADVIVHFLPLRDTALFLNRAKKILYRLCEFLSPEQAKQLIELVRNDPASSNLFENDITLSCDPKYLEFHILFWISRGYISVDGKVDFKNVTKHLKAMDLLDKVEEIENATRQIEKNKLTNSNAVDSLGLKSISVEKTPKVEKSSYISAYDDYLITDPDNLGLLIIINNVNFENNVEKQKKYKHSLPEALLNNRVGSDEDVKRLKELFQQLKFIVIVERDLKSYCMVDRIQELVKENFEPNKHSVLFLCILSHGAQGVIYGVNSVPIPIQDIQDAICGPHTDVLGDVPKVVIIQACQGLEKLLARQNARDPSLSSRRRLQTDGAELVCDGPDSIKYSDLLICKAIIEGYVAIRSTSNGSIYIQTLCQKIQEYYQSDHFYDIVTKVHRELNNKKMHLPVREKGNCLEHRRCAVVYMTPEVHSTFTGKLFLHPRTH